MYTEGEQQVFKNPYDDNNFDEDEVIDLSPSEQVAYSYKKQGVKISQPQEIELKVSAQQQMTTNNGSIFLREGDTYNTMGANLNEDGDPPLLEDIGIDPSLIWDKMKSIIIVDRPYQVYIDEPDLTGPIFIALVFGLELLAMGKLQFGDIYAMFISGNCLAYLLFNMMSQKEPMSLYSIMSILGYGLLPMLILGLFGIFVDLKGQFGIIVGILIAIWSAMSASNYVQLMIGGFDRRPLIVYPLILFYVSFVMITIF